MKKYLIPIFVLFVVSLISVLIELPLHLYLIAIGSYLLAYSTFLGLYGSLFGAMLCAIGGSIWLGWSGGLILGGAAFFYHSGKILGINTSEHMNNRELKPCLSLFNLFCLVIFIIGILIVIIKFLW